MDEISSSIGFVGLPWVKTFRCGRILLGGIELMDIFAPSYPAHPIT